MLRIYPADVTPGSGSMSYLLLLCRERDGGFMDLIFSSHLWLRVREFYCLKLTDLRRNRDHVEGRFNYNHQKALQNFQEKAESGNPMPDPCDISLCVRQFHFKLVSEIQISFHKAPSPLIHSIQTIWFLPSLLPDDGDRPLSGWLVGSRWNAVRLRRRRRLISWPVRWLDG